MRSSRVAPLVLLLLAAAPRAARADDGRQTVLTFQAGMSAIGPLDPPDDVGGPEDIGVQLRGIVSWEEPAPPYKEPTGYNVRGTVVPELFLGTIRAGDGATELLGAGLRLELAFAQRRMGLLQVSAKGAVYLAARGGLCSDAERTRFAEGAFGEYIRLGDAARLGIELGIMSIHATAPVDQPLPGGVVAGPPFDQGRGTYLNVDAAVYLGVTL